MSSDSRIEPSTDPHVLQAYSSDLWPRKLLELRGKGPAVPTIDGVVWPESVEDVQAVVRWAETDGVILIPYGAGSGVCGATIPSEDERRRKVIVDLKKMRRVRSVDTISMTVWAESGLIGENLERYLNQEGFTLGHFPSSIYCSSLGGYLATRSAGQLSTKYGKIEDMVLSLEMVTGGGLVLTTGRAPRSAMGADWTQLLLGTEGTLGIFTAANLQVHPLPEARVMMGFDAVEMARAIAFARRLMQQGVRPAVLRIYDATETALTLSQFGAQVAVVVIFEGLSELIESERQVALKIAKELQVRDIGPALGDHWWNHRYDVSYKQQMILSHSQMVLDTFEVAADWSHLEGVYRAVKSTCMGLGVLLAHLSHFYHTGANIYFTLVSHAGLSSPVAHYDRIWSDMMSAALDAGATLSHHHGVGTLKNDWIKKEKQDWIWIFERIKRGFDPENHFNPNKMGL